MYTDTVSNQLKNNYIPVVNKETNTGIASHRQARQKIYEILSGN